LTVGYDLRDLVVRSVQALVIRQDLKQRIGAMLEDSN
jgi:hypothetical protein